MVYLDFQKKISWHGSIGSEEILTQTLHEEERRRRRYLFSCKELPFTRGMLARGLSASKLAPGPTHIHDNAQHPYLKNLKNNAIYEVRRQFLWIFFSLAQGQHWNVATPCMGSTCSLYHARQQGQRKPLTKIIQKYQPQCATNNGKFRISAWKCENKRQNALFHVKQDMWGKYQRCTRLTQK